MSSVFRPFFHDIYKLLDIALIQVFRPIAEQVDLFAGPPEADGEDAPPLRVVPLRPHRPRHRQVPQQQQQQPVRRRLPRNLRGRAEGLGALGGQALRPFERPLAAAAAFPEGGDILATEQGGDSIENTIKPNSKQIHKASTPSFIRLW